MNGPKGKKAAKPPREPKRRPPLRAVLGWRGAAAAAVLLLFAYFFYFLDHLPQAAPVRPGTRWTVEATEQLRLHGLKGGTVLRLNFAAAAAAKLSFPRGTRMEADGEARPAAASLELNLFNVDRENAEIEIRIAPPEGRSATLVIEPRLPDPHLLSLRLHSDDAPLTVVAGIVPNPAANEHGQLQSGDEAFDEVSLTPPTGSSFSIGLRTEQLAAVRKEVGELDEGVQRIELSAVEVGTGEGDEFDRRRLACGATRGRVLWKRPIPGVAIGDCRSDKVSVVGLDLTGSGIRVDLQGAGFTVSDGTIHVWQGFREFRQNDIVKVLLGSVILALTAWAIATIRGRK